jgi:prevent-host-death family protein
MRWQLQEAKQRFSELVRHARAHGPQVVTKHGEEVAVVVSIEEYRRLTDDLPSFKDLLLAAPDLEALDLRRSRELARVVEME